MNANHKKQIREEILQRAQEQCHQWDVAAAEFADDPEIELLDRIKHQIKNRISVYAMREMVKFYN